MGMNNSRKVSKGTTTVIFISKGGLYNDWAINCIIIRNINEYTGSF